MISVDHLVKEYKIRRNKDGRFAAIRNLISSEYSIKKAVDDISFEIKKGEIVGYIGKNGAGKSTTIKMLSGILRPTSGKVTVNGIDPSKSRKENSKQIGVVFGQKTQLWWDVPLIESYRLLRDIYKINPTSFENNLNEFVELLDLQEALEKPVRQLSLGQRMKADIAASLLHDPPILFLDEPTIGVDVVSKKRLHEFILKMNMKKKTTILLITHDTSDMEKLCSRVMIIDAGKIVYSGSLEDMKKKYGVMRTLVIEFETDVEDFQIPHAVHVKSADKRKWYAFNRLETNPTALIQYVSSLYSVVDLQIIEPEIEDIVRALYNNEAGGV